MEKENMVRAIFNSEITWIISIIGFVWTVVVTIILPINTIQTQLAQIQSDNKTSQKNYVQLVTLNQDLDKRITVLETITKGFNNPFIK